MSTQFNNGRFRGFDNAGNALSQGRLYTYASGTSTFLTAYAEPTLTTPCTYTSDGLGGQYIALDARGEAQVWIGSTAYRMALQDSSGTPIWTVDGVQDSGGALTAQLGAGAGGGLIGHDYTLSYPTKTLGGALTGMVNAAELVGVDRTGTTDSTAALNTATAACKRLYLPTGTYLVNTLALRTDLEIYGDGDSTVIRPLSSATTFALYFDSGSSDPANNLQNLYVHDVQFRGWSDTAGLSQFLHLVAINGVTNALFERVTFRAARGDCVYIGSGSSGSVERHNIGVTFRKCHFDGVNHSGRNGLSVIDCKGLRIDDCYFENLSDPTMPGAIDVEPNHSYNVIRDIEVVGCRFYRNGGNAGFFALQVGNIGLTTPPSGFLLSGNVVDSDGYTSDNEKGLLISMYGDATSATYPLDFMVSDNTFRNVRNLVRGDGTSDVMFKDNRWLGSIGDGEMGATYRCLNTDFEDNTFYTCGSDLTLGGKGLTFFNMSYLGVRRNRFLNCGKSDGSAGIAINFNTGSSDNVSIEQNTVTGVNTLTAVAVQVGHTLSPATNRLEKNNVGTLDVSTFSAGWAKVTYDPPSLANNTETTATVTALGARFGRPVQYAFGESLLGLKVPSAWVDSADTIKLILRNETGGTVDLASTTLSVWAPPV